MTTRLRSQQGNRISFLAPLPSPDGSKKTHSNQERSRRHSRVIPRRVCIFLLIGTCDGWSVSPTRPKAFELSAKRNKRQQSRQDADDLNRWYDAVDADASPDDVFWEEMERQRLLAEVGKEDKQQATTASSAGNVVASTSYGTSGSPVAQTSRKPDKNVEATLAEFSQFMVQDNWLDEQLVELMAEDEFDDEEDEDIEEQNRRLEEQLEAMEDEDYDDDDDDDERAWMQSDEPWDHWGETDDERQENSLDFDPEEYLLAEDAEEDEEDEEEIARQEAEFLEHISKLTIKSRRLEKARRNPKAAAFFAREPDALEGFDRMWVSAIDNACFKNLMGVFRNYGVQFADNFGDWENGSKEDQIGFSIEDVASYKARKVYEVTGLPCIASRTSFEIEPVPSAPSPVPGRVENPRVVSGYRFNDVGMHVEYLCDALRPLSEPTRVTRFRTCLCFYDGEMEVFDYGVCDVDIHFADSLRTFISVAQAVNEMLKTLQLTFGLEFQKFLRERMDEARFGYTEASLKLRDRVLKEGRVLPNDIIDVSEFMDSKIDVNLMDECAEELSNRFTDLKPSKILTVATTGLVIALPMAKYLQVPVVYARKERNVVMADTYQANYASRTMGMSRQLLVSKSHLHPEDRILIVDDFLSSGAVQEALLRIVSDSGAKAIGVGVLLEKAYESGRQSLSGFDIPVQSLCRVASVKSGVIQLMEEEGFERM